MPSLRDRKNSYCKKPELTRRLSLPFKNNVCRDRIVLGGLVGVTSSVCISTKQPSLMMLGACVVSALMFGALFMNASAPRFSMIQSTFFIFPPVLTCWLIDLEYKYFFVMQLPLWYGGAF
jgi:hypothetical protein